ncbi:MAG: DUF5312 domain-containing protein [Treponema sp.]|jgi:hypothetical protein|nr:DUF5312 domain-containing protein [Treponema sp.]
MPDDNILNKVISFISGGEGGDDKQVLLKQVAKDIQQNKFAKFYKIRQEETDVSFAQYLYSVYKITYPARVYLKDPANRARIKQVTLESHLDKGVMEIIKRLTPEKVAERKTNSGPEFTAELERDLEALTTGFDSPKLAEADKCYSLMMVLYRFVSWDYPSILKKFDPEIAEDFSITPKFTPLRTDTIMADMAAFLSVLPSFDPKDNWRTVLEIFKYCRGGTDLIPFEVWNGLLSNLKELKNSKMIDMMIKLASGNPVWELKASMQPPEQLSADWLVEKTREIREVISGIVYNQKNAQIAALEKAVFGTNETSRLIYYNKERGKIFIQKDLEPYTYAAALNHLLAFIQDFATKEMQELSDLLLVRGQWTKNVSFIAMSEAYHEILEITPEITDLDETLSEDGTNGPRLRGALVRVDRDPSQARYLNSIVNNINEEALNIINRAVPFFIVIGKHLKMLLDDCQKKPYELIMNWKELALVSKIPIAQRLGDDYKKVNYFIQLMLMESKQEGVGE